jgi:hypothetical protein
MLTSGKPGAALAAYRAQRAPLGESRTVLTERLLFNEALGLMSSGEQLEAVGVFERAADRCRLLDRPECTLAAATMAASLASRMGDEPRRERDLQRALESSVSPISARRWGVLSELWLLADAYGAAEAGKPLLSESITVAEQLNRPDLVAEDIVRGASIRLRNDDRVALKRDVASLRRIWTTRLADDDRALYGPDLSWLAGEQLLQEGNISALDSLDHAIAALVADTNAFRMLRPLLAHARAVVLVGDTNRALAELDSILGATSAMARRDHSPFRRARLVDVSHEAGVLAATLMRRQGKALAMHRALTGREFRFATAGSPWDSSTIHLAVRRLGDSVLVWSHTSTAWQMDAVHLPSKLVSGVVTNLDSAGLALLFDRLTRSVVERASRGAKLLRVDARGDLASIPWPALRDARTGRYLVERLALRQVEDVYASPTDERLSRLRVVVVDAAPRSGQRALLAGSEESRAVREVWRKSAVVVDASLGIPNVIRAFSSGSIAHFAGHAVLDRARPDQSFLFIPAINGETRLTADRLSEARFREVDLMILSACDTRGASSGAGGGFDSLAGAVRAAGVRQVIAASWPVDDRETAAFMISLHQHLRSGSNPAEAMQAVQINSLRSSSTTQRTPRAWAAFQLLGS